MEQGRGEGVSNTNTFNLGVKTFKIPPGMYFAAGMTDVRAYVSFAGYLIGDILSYNAGTGDLSYNATDYNLGEATLGGTYSLWDLGQPSVISSPEALSTTVVGCVPGIYVFMLRAEDSGHAITRDTITVTVT
jgi:hypothetical protein